MLISAAAGSGSAGLDVLKVALTAVAGVGGAVALVVAYRRQHDLEQGRFVERFGAAAAQLGDPDPAVRIAGVYAMAGVADESTTSARRQQCIDVLCGYLRLPFDPAQGSTHDTEVVIATKRLPSDFATQRLERHESLHRKIRQNDREVRQTIVAVIAAHVRGNTDVSWSGHDFDFSTAVLESIDFKKARFEGQSTSFDRATFLGAVTTFEDAVFGGKLVSFRGARFDGAETTFAGAVFSSDFSRFDDAHFSARVTSFDVADFLGGYTSFDDAVFEGEITAFREVRFNARATGFAEVMFGGELTYFNESVFGGTSTSFYWATFDGKSVRFDQAVFSSDEITFYGTAFDAGATVFTGAVFSGDAVSFVETRSWQNMHFDWNSNPDMVPPAIRPQEWPPLAGEPLHTTKALFVYQTRGSRRKPAT